MKQNQPTKTCSKCGEEKPATLEYFGKGKPSNKYGLYAVCKDCCKRIAKKHRERNKKRNFLLFEQINRPDETKRCSCCKKEYLLTNEFWHKSMSSKTGFRAYCKQCRREKTQILYYRDIEKSRKKSRDKYRNNIEVERSRGRKRSLARYYRIRNDPAIKIRGVVKVSIHSTLKSFGFKKKTHSSVWNNLPYTPQQLKNHLESLFEPWMSWKNYGKLSVNGERTWNIDHIVPQAALPYDSFDHPNFLKCWALSNLRPLCSKENASKGSLFEGKRYTYKNDPAK